MLNIQRYNDLGKLDISWLSAHYHFSFSNYYNPQKMGVGPLRVINDDIVHTGGGFDFHSHKDMEIITYVRSGAITHRDNLGNHGRTEAGDVQVMSAGTGITHAEHNEEKTDTNLYQIWITPHVLGVPPRWETRRFDKTPIQQHLRLLVSGMPEDRAHDAMFMHVHARIWGGVLPAGAPVSHPLQGAAYLLVSEGEVAVDGEHLRKGDGAEIQKCPQLKIKAVAASEVVLIDLPTYGNQAQ